MKLFIGLDVSLAKTAICVVSEHGEIVQEAEVTSEPEPLLAWLQSVDDTMTASAQYTPKSSETSYVEAAVSVNLRLRNLVGAPVFQAQLAQVRNDVGVSTTGFRVDDTEQALRAGLEMRF